MGETATRWDPPRRLLAPNEECLLEIHMAMYRCANLVPPEAEDAPSTRVRARAESSEPIEFNWLRKACRLSFADARAS